MFYYKSDAMKNWLDSPFVIEFGFIELRTERKLKFDTEASLKILSPPTMRFYVEIWLPANRIH